jgi:hypothetical protein
MARHNLKLLKNNDNRDWEDVEWVREFYDFLKGEALPEGMQISKGHKPKLATKKAQAVIWFLQEHFSLIPDNIEFCSICNEPYNSDSEGLYNENESKHYCGAHDHLAPYDEDYN